jgi:hypothetical protein
MLDDVSGSCRPLLQREPKVRAAEAELVIALVDTFLNDCRLALVEWFGDVGGAVLQASEIMNPSGGVDTELGWESLPVRQGLALEHHGRNFVEQLARESLQEFAYVFDAGGGHACGWRW